ncbi:MAG TPA: transaldolase [Acidimicrobiales bacterium]|nr:transaldolase [Acidimicrobiales bacterium]
MTKLHELYSTGGQSPWLDNLKRSYITGGQLQKLCDEGIRGVTSNPTIFAKAIEGETTYDEQFGDAIGTHESVRQAYWDLVTTDVTDALGVLRPVYDESGGEDGFVSLEVDPTLAHDTAGTIEAARGLHARVDLPNLFVKIPATAAGVPAIRQMIAEGHSINVTLIFSLARYAEVIEAYISGLEELAGTGADISRVTSVASFFVSRVDTEVDRRLEASGGEKALSLRGKAAVAQARLAYEMFGERFSGPRWEALAGKGAKVQRPLWASTSTKNPAYPDLLYVDSLIGPHTVNTLPDATIAAFLDHGTVARTIDADFAADRSVLDDCAEVGVDLADVADVLEREGVGAFEKSFDELVESLEQKAADLSSRG